MAECCEEGGLCRDEACVMPGSPCNEDIECPEGFGCDIEMGRCLPRGSRLCEYRPSPGDFMMAEQWRWDRSDTAPENIHVSMTPVIGDVDLDGSPDVIFISYGEGLEGPGVLRFVRGDTGREFRSITSPSICATSGIALADLDGDGRPEIVVGAGARCTAGLIAFHNDGTVAWQSRDRSGNPMAFPLKWGAPSIADLEADGRPEVIVGGMVFEYDGTLRFDRGIGAGANCCGSDRDQGPLTAAYDADADGQLEIVSGNAVWEADGSVLWERSGAPDGFVALADFFDDDQPDIVVVHDGMVSIRGGATGEDLWGPAVIPGGGVGGPPTIADFDGDGLPEFGVAGSTRYNVFDVDGMSNLLWSVAIEDDSSGMMGSSVFDFDGDGEAEVMYNDECFLRVFRGSDGATLAEIPQSSDTVVGYPVAVDVDGDANSEIVVAASHQGAECDSADGIRRDFAGVRVLRDVRDNWLGTRSVWNQHSYHVMNILSDLSVPSPERPAWRRFNHFRQNPQNFDAPDLVALDAEAADEACVGEVRLRALVINQGAVLVPRGLPISFYNGTPDGEHSLIGTVELDIHLPPSVGSLVDVFRPIGPTEYDREFSWFARADDRGDGVGIHNECDETNNVTMGTFNCPGIE